MREALVYVHRNLHSGADNSDYWSLLLRGKVFRHESEVLGLRARFAIRPSGVARAIREGRKNVHAFVSFQQGDYRTPEDLDFFDLSPNFDVTRDVLCAATRKGKMRACSQGKVWFRAQYVVGKGFLLPSGDPAYGASRCYLSTLGMWIRGPLLGPPTLGFLRDNT